MAKKKTTKKVARKRSSPRKTASRAAPQEMPMMMHGSQSMGCCSMKRTPKFMFMCLVSEAALYFFLYFLLSYLGVVYAWVPALVLWIFANLMMCHKKKCC